MKSLARDKAARSTATFNPSAILVSEEFLVSKLITQSNLEYFLLDALVLDQKKIIYCNKNQDDFIRGQLILFNHPPGLKVNKNF